MAKKLKLIPSSPPQRPTPPGGLPGPAAALWRDIVSQYPPRHFNAANQVLLESLCRCWAMVCECDQTIATDGMFPDGKAHPAVKVRAVGWAEIRLLAPMLRLNISATMRAEAAAARPDPKHTLRKPWEA